MPIPTPEELALEEAIRRRDHPIEELDLNTKTYRVLSRCGVETIGQLVVKTEEELDEFPNLGPKMLKEIVDVLEQNGLALRLTLPGGQASRKRSIAVNIGRPVQADPNVTINKHSGRTVTVRIGEDFKLERFLYKGEKFDVAYGGQTYTLVPGDVLTLPEFDAD